MKTKDNGYLPLHDACSDKNVTIDFVQFLILNGVRKGIGTMIGKTNEDYCGGLLVKDMHGDIPIKIIFRRLMFLKSSSNYTNELDANSMLWQKLCFVVKATYLVKRGLSFDKHCDYNIPIVHAIIECGGHTNLVKFALQLYPEQATSRDLEGRTPLTVASTKVDTNPEIFHLLLNDEKVKNDEYLRSESEKKIPMAAMADEKGKLPLHLALASGRTLSNGVELIVNDAPLAVQTRDIQSGMYPFMIASIPNYRWDNTCIDTIYTMIRTVPHVMQKFSPEKEN